MEEKLEHSCALTYFMHVCTSGEMYRLLSRPGHTGFSPLGLVHCQRHSNAGAQVENGSNAVLYVYGK